MVSEITSSVQNFRKNSSKICRIALIFSIFFAFSSFSTFSAENNTKNTRKNNFLRENFEEKTRIPKYLDERKNFLRDEKVKNNHFLSKLGIFAAISGFFLLFNQNLKNKNRNSEHFENSKSADYFENEKQSMKMEENGLHKIEKNEKIQKNPENSENSEEFFFKNSENYDKKFGFSDSISSRSLPPGLSSGVVKKISLLKNEPFWLKDFRMEGYRNFCKRELPTWGNAELKNLNFQDFTYFSEPGKGEGEEATLGETFEKLGVGGEKEGQEVVVERIYDSVSVAPSSSLNQKQLRKLEELGIIFCPLSEAVKKHPELVRKYLGSVVPPSDNFFAALNSSVFSDGSFVYIPDNTICPLPLATYFRINHQNLGQFERTLIVCGKNSEVSYVEGCSAPSYRKRKILHAAVVELVAEENAKIKYSTVQNWYPGEGGGGGEEGGGVLNLVTKRGRCKGKNSRIEWAQVETGSAVTWKYPSCVLEGEGSSGEFRSVALTSGNQQADSGTKMIHIGNNTTSKILAKGISTQDSKNTYRGLVEFRGEGGRNFSQCDSLLFGNNSTSSTIPTIDYRSGKNNEVGHEASTSKVSDSQIAYLKSRGLGEEEANTLLLQGFCGDIFKNLPFEFASEASELLNVKMKGSIG